MKDSRAKLFIFENVKGMLSIQRGELFNYTISIFESLGYRVDYKILNAAEYGVPQIRERIIIVGTKKDLVFRFPKTTHGKGKVPFVTLKEAISDLPMLKNGEQKRFYENPPENNFQTTIRGNSKELLDHEAPKNNPNLVKIMETLKDGETPQSLPQNMRPKSGFNNCYSKLWWNKPSMTITRNLGTPSSARCVHPKDSRPLTTREGARLQTFPDTFKFTGSRGKKNLQIGEAVPPILSSSLLTSVLETLRDNVHFSIPILKSGQKDLIYTYTNR